MGPAGSLTAPRVRAVEGINLGMATDCNISAYKILVNGSIKITNQVT